MDGQRLQTRKLRRENLATSIPIWTTRIRKAELQIANQAHAMWQKCVRKINDCICVIKEESVLLIDDINGLGVSGTLLVGYS